MKLIKLTLGHEKKNLFYRWMDLSSRVGRSFFFNLFISGSKNDPKHTKIMKKSDTFCKKKLGEIF